MDDLKLKGDEVFLFSLVFVLWLFVYFLYTLWPVFCIYVYL